jgi:hypothetical protein
MGWGKNLDAVSGGELGEAGGIGRDRFGQAQLMSQFSDICHDLVKPRGRPR